MLPLSLFMISKTPYSERYFFLEIDFCAFTRIPNILALPPLPHYLVSYHLSPIHQFSKVFLLFGVAFTVLLKIRGFLNDLRVKAT